MKSVNRYLTRLSRDLGWTGVAGIGLVVFAAAFWLSTVRPTAGHLAEMRDVVTKHERLRLEAAGSDVPTREEQLGEFYEFFPQAPTAPDWLEKIYAAAERNALVLEQGEYSLVADKGGKLMRYQISFPVKGSYVQIRKFIDTVLGDVPVSSLEHVQFRRDKVGQNTVDATIRLVVYLGRKKS